MGLSVVSGVTDDSVVVAVGGGVTVGSGVVGSGPASVQPPLPDKASE